MAKQVQGALPLVGLLSRLTSPSGGIGRDELVSCRPSCRYRRVTDNQGLLRCAPCPMWCSSASRRWGVRICQHDLDSMSPHMLLVPADATIPDSQLQQCLFSISKCLLLL